MPPKDYLQRIREICRENDILFVSDEVVTGFGRLGHVFASGEVFGIEPDMITFAKGVTSGYFPLGGVMISERLLKDLRRSNHPDAMFAPRADLHQPPDRLRRGAGESRPARRRHPRRMRARSAPYFQERLKTLEELPLVGEVRGAGLMGCVECVADRESKNPLQLDKDVGKRIDAHCHELGLLVRPLINMCVMSPPLVIIKGTGRRHGRHPARGHFADHGRS